MGGWRADRYTGRQDRETGSGEEGRTDWGWDNGTQRGRREGNGTGREGRRGERRRLAGRREALCLETRRQEARPCLGVRRGWKKQG